MQTADVVIAGGGIVGSSIAWHLTEAGCRNVLVLEKETHTGKGSTGKSMGGVRAQFSTELNIRLSLHSIPFLRDFEQITGRPSGYRGHGYLFMATQQSHMDYLKETSALQTSLGLKGVELLKPEDIQKMVPVVRTDDVLGGAFCPTDGFVDPYSVMNGFMERAAERGATLQCGTEVTAIRTSNGAVTGVDTNHGRIDAPVVVNAAGAWAAPLAETAGVDLPVKPLRRMLVPTEKFSGLRERTPMTIDMSNGFHFRPEGLGVLMAWNDPEETYGYRTHFDHGFVEKILTRAVNRVPAFEEVEVNPKRGWAGLYEMTPDHYPVLGPAPNVKGLYFANGFSGHGVMHSPATGKLLSEWILEGAPKLVDATPLQVTRFAEGKLIEEKAVL